MLNLPPGVSSSAPTGFVTFPLQKIRAPICAQSIKSAGNRRVAAASLQEMHNGSFALLSNRVNELKLPTICSPPKESARDEHSLCNGWTCRSAALQELLQRVVELSGRRAPPTSAKHSHRARCGFCWECSVSVPKCCRRRPHCSSSRVGRLAPLKASKKHAAVPSQIKRLIRNINPR